MISLFYSCEFSWSICLSASKGLENRFWSIFSNNRLFPPPCRFVGKPFWGIISVSAMAEMLFSPFFVFRPWPKRIFFHFFAFGRGRNVIFTVFCSSAVAESRFLPFFQFQPWRKRCFRCFLFIRRGGKPIFAVFCPSYPYERLFLPFFIDCTPTKRGFSRFLSVVPLRKAVFAVFY